ncbi:MAG: RNA 2',3'-cyclic phosphodiesterase [Desulfobacula sp.]|uniref:RNA 2',3'-cyclic phosphodiesterase n=1 Tax=Desulfobacula sp. TaxID=2593537 RepID=UPI0025C71252|nr:RNA 2',3'-cyclic phosphodiesterase [Desulfobacula sp.]MCD4722987.1 RNA 2',3'-cyclic phosphodiesterase [Desulfobacula sp.]
MNDDNHHIRAFIAISLPKEIKKFLQDIQGQLQTSGLKASWPKPETMHLTLKFLGNISISKLDAVRTCMTKAVTGIPIHTLFVSGIGVFPTVKKARAIWSGTRGQTDILEKLVNHLEVILFEEMGIKKENRRFSPHLTIARVKKPIFPKTMIQLLREFKDFHSEDFFVSEIKFFQSELSSSGAIHKTIFSIPFRH